MKPSGPSRPQVWHLWFEPKWWDWCAVFEEAILEHKWIRTKLLATITVVYIQNCCPRADASVMLWYSELLWAGSMYEAVNNGCQRCYTDYSSPLRLLLRYVTTVFPWGGGGGEGTAAAGHQISTAKTKVDWTITRRGGCFLCVTPHLFNIATVASHGYLGTLYWDLE